MITDPATLDVLKEVLGDIKWNPNIEVNIGQEEVKANFFYRYDKNMPERIVKYRMWFNEYGEVNILSNLKYENYGKLSGKHAQELKRLVINH
ncbi:hypothetical protein [Chengkuizengella marina]|uniref:Uncharacterized protein n=1 Tax=Chengkuizengella marina TaxID=2507566 RepID=A0A6N9PZ09_9BACL|nr:hypothetical protein [Chengkuizengella marina]NBI28207.1 hypothetical protein [Chengkuizengella marina]